MEEAERTTYAKTHGLPQFTLDTDRLREALTHTATGPDDESSSVDPIGELWDGDTNADAVHKLIEQACDSGAITAPHGWEIVIYPREINDGSGQVITVWSTATNDSCQVVAETSEITALASRELWEGEDAIERTVAIVEYVVTTANAVAVHVVGAEGAARKVQRHYDERRDGHGFWLLTNHLSAENNKHEDRTPLEETQKFATAEEAIKEVERLIEHFHTATVADNLDHDVPIDLGIEKFITATRELEAFRRAEIPKWTLTEDHNAITLEHWPAGAPF